MPNYVYPGTDTVKNTLDAKNLDELDRLEGPLVRARRILIDSGQGPAGQFDAEQLELLSAGRSARGATQHLHRSVS